MLTAGLCRVQRLWVLWLRKAWVHHQCPLLPDWCAIQSVWGLRGQHVCLGSALSSQWGPCGNAVLSVSASVCLCMCVRVYFCLPLCTCVCTFVSVFMCLCAHVCTCVFVSVCVYLCVCVRLCLSLCLCVHVHMCVHTCARPPALRAPGWPRFGPSCPEVFRRVVRTGAGCWALGVREGQQLVQAPSWGVLAGKGGEMSGKLGVKGRIF